MMSLSQIVYASESAARRAKAKGQRPLEVGTYMAEADEQAAYMDQAREHAGEPSLEV